MSSFLGEFGMERLIILALAIVTGGFLCGGIYQVSAGQAGSYVVNRFTGSVSYCNTDCHALLNRN
jgi:hypothetical protein